MDFSAIAQECAPQVSPVTLAAIVKHESNFRPLAININGGARLERQPVNTAEAVMTAQWLIGQGFNIDMGLGQINSANLPRLRMSVAEIFEPCKNLGASARILAENFKAASLKTNDSQEALRLALSAYNTGNFRAGFQNGYVQKVMANMGVSVAPAMPALSPIPLIGKSKPANSRAVRATSPAPEAPRAETQAPSSAVNVYTLADTPPSQAKPTNSILVY